MQLMIESYLLLLQMECFLVFRQLPSLLGMVRLESVGGKKQSEISYLDKICHAMDLACVFYPKQVLCLQRSSALTVLLRRHGIPAEMVIGAQLLPFRSHAWIEVEGALVSDRPYVGDNYRQLDRYW